MTVLVVAAGSPQSTAPSPCPGRPEVSERLTVAMLRAQEGHGSTTLVTGPSGIGKTFVMDWIAREAEAAGFRVLRGSFPERTSPPLSTLNALLGALGTRALEGGRAAVDAQGVVPPALTILNHLRTLIHASAERPIALLLDDAHRADPESIVAFQLYARAFGGLRGLLVAALVDQSLEEGPGGDPLWKRSLDLLTTEGTVAKMPLAGLDAATSRAVIEEAGGGGLVGADGEEIASGLLSRTGGNPLFLREMVGLLKGQHQLHVEGGRLRLDPAALREPGDGVGGGWGRFPLPPTLRRLVLSRLDHVLPADLRLLQTAALVGSPFDLSPLAGVLSRTLRDLEATCADLARLGLLREGRSEDERTWSFAHDLVWEVVLRDAPPADLRSAARALAEWWQANRPEEVETVARLFHDAREPLEGLPHVREAIDRALRAEATAAAETYFRWYFDLLELAGGSAEPRSREALALVDGLLVRRLRRETLGVLKALEQVYPGEDLHWEIGWREVHVLVSFDLPRAERRLEELTRELGDLPPDRRGLRPAQWAFVRSEVLGARLQWADAIAAGVEALGLWGEKATAWEKGRTLYEIGWAQLMLGRLPSAREFLEELRALTLRAEVPALRATSLVFEGTLSLMEGNLRAAARAYVEGGSRLLELGAMEGYGISKNNLAEVLVHLGRLDEARSALAEAELVGSRFGYPRVVQGCALKWAWLNVFEGRWSEALLSLDEAEKGGREGDFAEELWEARLLHAWASGMAGSPGAALAELERVRKEEEKLQPHVRPYLFRAEGALLERAGRPGAREALQRSLDAAQRYSGAEARADALRAIARWERVHGGPEAAREAEEASARLLGETPARSQARPPLPRE